MSNHDAYYTQTRTLRKRKKKKVKANIDHPSKESKSWNSNILLQKQIICRSTKQTKYKSKSFQKPYVNEVLIWWCYEIPIQKNVKTEGITLCLVSGPMGQNASMCRFRGCRYKKNKSQKSTSSPIQSQSTKMTTALSYNNNNSSITNTNTTATESGKTMLYVKWYPSSSTIDSMYHHQHIDLLPWFTWQQLKLYWTQMTMINLQYNIFK